MQRLKRRGSKFLEIQVKTMRQKGFVTVAEASKISAVPGATLYRWMSDGVVESQRVGLARIYISLKSLAKLVPGMVA